jgi:hypothetical protein
MFRAPFLMVDPGASGTITVDRYGAVVPIVTAGAEARTLAQPTKAGIVCTIVIDTYVGACTLTVTGGYNADAATSITLGTAGDFVTFISIKVGASYYWRVLAQEGTNVAVEDFAVDQLSVTSLTVAGSSVVLDDMTEGSGITGATGLTCEHSVEKVGGLYKTTIVIDLTGLNSGGTDGDIIGKNGGTANCHIGQITAAKNGTIFAGRMTCLEVPTGGSPDIDLYSATESTGAEDAAISGLEETALLTAGGNWTLMQFKPLTAFPAADKYLYLVGNSGDATYTAGIYEITLWGK